jgi:hypothetical protein
VTGSLNSFPMRIDWENTLPAAEQISYPDPIVSSRDAVVPYVIAPVASLRRYAEDRGWLVLLQYAHGYVPLGREAKPSPQSRESFALRMRRGRQYAVALYMAGASRTSPWSWDMLYVWQAGQFPTQAESLAAFKAVL